MLSKATLPLLVRPKDEIEETSLLAGVPVPSFSVCRLLNLVVGIYDLDKRRGVLLVLLVFLGTHRVRVSRGRRPIGRFGAFFGRAPRAASSALPRGRRGRHRSSALAGADNGTVGCVIHCARRLGWQGITGEHPWRHVWSRRHNIRGKDIFSLCSSISVGFKMHIAAHTPMRSHCFPSQFPGIACCVVSCHIALCHIESPCHVYKNLDKMSDIDVREVL
jgi:hypothetical protein